MSRKTQTHGRGYCGIGVQKIKTPANVGTLWRSAVCFGADFAFTVGRRYNREPADTVASYRHLPMWHFADTEDFLAHMPYDCQLVGVELHPHARALETFQHPEHAIYILGPEDGNLSEQIVEHCQHLVRVNTAYCLNVAVCGSIVLYDRIMKRSGWESWNGEHLLRCARCNAEARTTSPG